MAAQHPEDAGTAADGGMTDGGVTDPGVTDTDGGAAADLEDRLRRALADNANLRQRHARQAQSDRLAEADRVAAAFLPVVDNLELALAHAGDDTSPLVEGVRAVRDQAVAVLGSLGYPRQDPPPGQPFGPQAHEAVGVVHDSGQPPGAIVQVVRPGYGDGPRQLRPAAVIVAGAP